MMWLLLALAIFLAGWMVIRFADGWRSGTIDGRRHPDDVTGQVYDFARMKAALEKRYPGNKPRWYAYDPDEDTDTDPTIGGTR